MIEKKFRQRFKKYIKDNISALNSVDIAKGFNVSTIPQGQYPACAIEFGHAYHENQNNELCTQQVSVHLAIKSNYRDVRGEKADEEVLDLRQAFFTKCLRIYSLPDSSGADHQRVFMRLHDTTPTSTVESEGCMIHLLSLLYTAEYEAF